MTDAKKPGSANKQPAAESELNKNSSSASLVNSSKTNIAVKDKAPVKGPAPPVINNGKSLPQGGLEEVTSPNALRMTIRVLQARNLKGSKGDKVSSFARVQFADFDYKESPVVNDTPAYNFEFNQVFELDDNLLDTFANKTVSISLVETLPKDKTQPLGSAEASLFPHFFKADPNSDATTYFPDAAPDSKISFVQWRDWVPITTATAVAGAPTPELELEITLSRPLLRSEDLENGNILTIKMEDMWNVPDDWSVKEGTEKDLSSNLYTYTLAVSLPLDEKNRRTIQIPGGLLVETSESPTQHTTSQNALNGNTENAPRKRVVWNKSVRTIINRTANSIIRDALLEKKNEVIGIEILRCLQPKFQHLTDVNLEKAHGTVDLDITPLVYPKAMNVKGQFAVDQVPPKPLQEIYNALAETNEEYKNKTVHENNYRKNKTTISVELSLENPLLQKKKLQPITKAVRDFVPKRDIPAAKLRARYSKKAQDDYKEQVRNIVRTLVKEYRTVGEMDLPDDPRLADIPEDEQRVKRFYYHLNKEGIYYTFKEELKAAVSNVFREHFEKKSPFANASEKQVFMSEVYVYLVQTMHDVLNQMFREGPSSLASSQTFPALDFKGFKALADEAEWEGNYALATFYHQERVAMRDDQVQAWFDYGAFEMRRGSYEQGVECFKQILSLNDRHVPALMAYGAYAAATESFDKAGVFLKTAVDVDPKNPVAWTLLGLYYETIEQEEAKENAFEEARRCSTASDSFFFKTSEFLVLLNNKTYADRAIAKEMTSTENRVPVYLLLARLELQRGNFTDVYASIQKALELSQDDPDAWAALGHAHYTRGEYKEARSAYETVLSLNKESKMMALIYARLGKIYLNCVEEGEHALKMAKTVYLKSAQIVPSASSWLGVGKACFRLGEYVDAEDALTEANALNNRDGEIWANLALLSATLKRSFEASRTLAQALKFGIHDAYVLRELGRAFLANDDFRGAAECLRLALEMEPNDEQARHMFLQAVQRRSGRIDTSTNEADEEQTERRRVSTAVIEKRIADHVFGVSKLANLRNEITSRGTDSTRAK